MSTPAPRSAPNESRGQLPERAEDGGQALRPLAWARRLGVLAFIALGVWLWQSNVFVQPRELIWQVGEDRSIAWVEIQLWSGQGELIKREAFSFAQGAPFELAQKVPLIEGTYQARVFIRRGAGAEEAYAQTVRVGSERSLVLSLRGSDGRP